MHFEVIFRKMAAPRAAALHHPAPIESRGPQARGLAVPRDGPKLSHLLERYSNVASIANNVHEQRAGNVGLDLRHIQNAIGVINSPAMHSLLPCHSIHHYADEVASTAAAFSQFRRK